MKETPSVTNGAILTKITIQDFSTNSKVSIEDVFLLFLARNTNPSPSDSKELKALRSKLHASQLASEHLKSAGFPPIFDAISYSLLRGNHAKNT
jgi:hypothetical protein